MKSQKGITLISLTIYVIVMTIVIGVIATVTGVFFKNLQQSNYFTDPIAEYTKFNSYFSEEVNHEGLKILKCEENYIAFDNGIVYTFSRENQGIYRNQVKICKDIETCTFSEEVKNGKQVVEVSIKSGSHDRTTTYTLKK